MNEFSRYHPAVNFLYFASVILFAMFLMHPVCLAIGLINSFAYSVATGGKKAVKFNFAFILPMAIGSVLLNAAFNHQGMTILAYLPSGNPLTLESIVYGFAAAIMIMTVIFWFSCHNKIMTGDKFVYLFGRLVPSLSLILSMVLRFVPRFKEQMRVVNKAQKGIGRSVRNGNLIRRAENGMGIFSAVVTWALENSIETADSMKSRGFGRGARTAYSIYKAGKSDVAAFVWMLFLTFYIAVGAGIGSLHYVYYPKMLPLTVDGYEISLFVAYFLLCFTPIAIEIKEVAVWKYLRSKI
ncbi:MAG: energy-coupling factor transporter transmembrane component T [Bacillota bacterium]|nr:energy-coupling factor transporter transmembrane component T [Bacillota bacterium]